MILVDTSVWIDLFNGLDSQESLTLQRLIIDGNSVSICELVLTEILQGIKNDDAYMRSKEILLKFSCVKTVGIDTYVAAADIYRKCRKGGKTIRSTVDCIIAAICIENNLELLHKDRDFDIIAQCTKLKVLRADKKYY